MLSACSTTHVSGITENKDLWTCINKEPVSLDPRKGNDVVASQIHFMLFEGLVRVNPDMTISLGQAESYEISPDKKTYVFHLRDACWSDKSPVTSYDFEASWKSILDPCFPSPDAYLLYCIKNARLAKMRHISKEYIGIQSIDAKTLVIELEYPVPYFLHIAASSVLLPINAKKDQEDIKWSSHLQNFISNGPFQLKRWALNEQVVLQKNPHHHRAHEITLDHIIIDILDSEMKAFELYLKGRYDVIGSPFTYFPCDQLDMLKAERIVSFFPVAGTKFLSFNTSRGVLQNTNIRRALAYAISRKTIIERITKFNEKEALNVIPSLLVSDHVAYFMDGDELTAKECFRKGVQELNINQVENISLTYVASELNHILAQELQHIWLRVLGIDIVLKAIDFKMLHAYAQQGEYDIALFVWLADYGDPMSILERFTDKENPRNYPKWENARYDHCLREARAMAASNQYGKKLREAEEILIDEMPFTCLFHESFAFLISSKIHNFTVSPIGHIHFDRIIKCSE